MFSSSTASLVKSTSFVNPSSYVRLFICMQHKASGLCPILQGHGDAADAMPPVAGWSRKLDFGQGAGKSSPTLRGGLRGIFF